MSKNTQTAAAHYARTRKELAGALGYDVDRLTAAQEMRLDNVVALKLAGDTLRAALLRGEEVDHRELLAITDGLTKLLPREPEPEPVDDGDDPHANLMRIIEGWIEADEANKRDAEAERRALGLPADELEAARVQSVSGPRPVVHCYGRLLSSESSSNARILFRQPGSAQPYARNCSV